MTLYPVSTVYKVSTCLALRRKSHLQVNQICVPEYFCYPVPCPVQLICRQTTTEQHNKQFVTQGFLLPQVRSVTEVGLQVDSFGQSDQKSRDFRRADAEVQTAAVEQGRYSVLS